MKFCFAGWRQKLHYLQFTLWVFLWTLWWRPTWIYASDRLSCSVAALLSLILGVRLIYHEHDSPSLGESISAFQQLVLSARRRVAHHASVCIIPSEARAEQFRAGTATERPVLAVWNCPALEEVRDDSRYRIRDQFIVFFHGSIVPARLPKAVLEALTMLPDEVSLRIAGYETIGHTGYITTLEGHAKALGLNSRFEFIGAFPRRRDLLEQCSNANVGLALMPLQSNDDNEKAMAGASNKPFDYLACGLALLVTDLPDWRKVFIQSGYGLGCNPEDPESIARQLRWFLDHRRETSIMGSSGRQRVLSEWNYEGQFSHVLHHLAIPSRT